MCVSFGFLGADVAMQDDNMTARAETRPAKYARKAWRDSQAAHAKAMARTELHRIEANIVRIDADLADMNDGIFWISK
jgi:hypothetical protein